MDDVDDEEITGLSIGAIFGGSSPWEQRWNDGIMPLMRKVAAVREGVVSPVNINVVFQVPGHALKPDFEGVRTGSFRRKDSWLMVQVALPEETPVDVDGYLKQQLAAAIDAAERWARKRKLVDDLQSLRRLVDSL